MPERSTLPYSLGLVTLGDLVQPIVQAGSASQTEQSIQGTTYRSEQSHGRIQLVAYPEGHPEESVCLLNSSIEVSGKHPGSEIYTIHVKVLKSNQVEVRVQALSKGTSILMETVDIPLALIDLETVDCPNATELDSRLMAMHAEVMMRWFRGLLRERDVRVGTRDIVYETRDATTALEGAIDSGDIETLVQQIGVLRHYGEEVCRRTGLIPFPDQMPLIFFPEAS